MSLPQHYAKEEKDDEIAVILNKMIPISRAEPGCALYIVNRAVPPHHPPFQKRGLRAFYSASCRFHVAADARNASDAGGHCTRLGAFVILFRLRTRRPTLFRTVPAR